MKKNFKQFFSDLKTGSKYLWYVVRFLIYLAFISISFQLMSIASTVGNTLGFLLLCAVIIIGLIRTARGIAKFFKSTEAN